MIETLIFQMNHTRNQTLKLVADLSEDQMVYQPAEKVNHPAWVLGHLLQVEYSLYGLLQPGVEVPAYLDDAWKNIYGMKSTPVSDKKLYKPKAFYIEELNKAREKIIARLKQIKPEYLFVEHPDPARRERFKTLANHVFLYAGWHEAYHSGQLSTWRRVQGLPAV